MNFWNFFYTVMEVWPWLFVGFVGVALFVWSRRKASARRPVVAPRPLPAPIRKGLSESEREMRVVLSFKNAGFPEDATLLCKMFADRDAILDFLAHGTEHHADTRDIDQLVRATTRSTVRLAEHILDFERRAADPLLGLSEAGVEDLEHSRGDLHAAYVALVNTRSRLRRCEVLHPDAFNPHDYAPLRKLVAALEDESEIAKRVETRMTELDNT